MGEIFKMRRVVTISEQHYALSSFMIFSKAHMGKLYKELEAPCIRLLQDYFSESLLKIPFISDLGSAAYQSTGKL